MSAGPRIHLIVARAENGVIGDGEKMLWTLRDDLAYFKRVTMGSPLIMGRRTWASIGRPLPGRRNLVLTRDASFRAEGAEVFASPEAALEAVADADDVYVIGGGEIYRLFLERADCLHITEVKATVEGEVTFPAVELDDRWRRVMDASHDADERNEFPFQICVYRRHAKG